jgi:hypothetical protein
MRPIHYLLFALGALVLTTNASVDPVAAFINTVGCQSGEADCDPLVDAFTQEAKPAARKALYSSPHVKDLRSWVVGGQHANMLELTKYPEQIHLTITKADDAVTVLWTTSPESNNSQACWWPEGNPSQSNCNEGSTWTYSPITEMPWAGNIHGATMSNLSAGARYCYTVGDPALNTTSNITCFVAPTLAWDSPRNEFTFFFGGDMGTYQLVGHKVARQMRADEVSKNLQVDAFWLLGDIAYSTLDPPRQNFEFFWDLFLRQEESLANHVPMLTSYGNHDFGGGDSAAFLNRFRNPNTDASGSPFYWAYDHGPVRFVSMCTEMFLQPVACDYSPGSPQYLWLESQLSSINRTKTPWLIFAGHRPMYSSDSGMDSGPLRRHLEPLLQRHQVDVALWGHLHETELVGPVYDKIANSTGVTANGTSFAFEGVRNTPHITVATLGAVIEEQWDTPRPAWSLFRKGTLLDDAYGYGQLTATREQLKFEFFRQKDNSTMWDLTIKK